MFWRLLPRAFPGKFRHRHVPKYSPMANCICSTRPRRFGLSVVFLDPFPSMFWRIPARVNGGKSPHPRGYCRMSPTHDRWGPVYSHRREGTIRTPTAQIRLVSGISRDVPVHVLVITAASTTTNNGIGAGAQIFTYGQLHISDPAAQIRLVSGISRPIPQHVLANTCTGQRG